MKTTPAFATLADDFRAALIDTNRIGYPLDVLESEVRQRADQGCRLLIPHLHRAHRMVLNDDFTSLAVSMVRRSPVTMAKMLDIARLPFDNLWLEWSQPVAEEAIVAANYRKPADVPKKAGVLIIPIRINDTIQAYRAIVVEGYGDQGGTGPTPVGLIFSMTDEIAPWRDHEDPETPKNALYLDHAPMGDSYMEGVTTLWRDELPLARAIGSHASIAYSPPFGLLHKEAIEHANIAIIETTAGAERQKVRDVIDRQRQWLSQCTREIAGLWRWLIVVFGLYNTGGGEFVISESRRQGRQGFRKSSSGFLPAYEYRVLKVKRPTTPEIIETKLPATSTLGKRWHTVAGSWHHHRLATAECARHPKICPIAEWQRMMDEEGNEIRSKGKDGIGEQRYECAICHRQRWYVPKHERGDKAFGIVDKGYEVSATGSPHPSHRTEEVIEKLPPGVRIKSLPRFDAVEQRKEGEQ